MEQTNNNKKTVMRTKSYEAWLREFSERMSGWERESRAAEAMLAEQRKQIKPSKRKTDPPR
jgi:hypothetical protein